MRQRSGRPLRVIHIVTAFQRHPDDVITPWLSALISAQRAEGVDASVLAPSYRGGGSVRVGEIPVRRFRYAPARWERLTHEETVPDRLRRSPGYLMLIPFYVAGGLVASLRAGRSRPDIVHVHWPLPHALFGAAVRFASGGRTALVCTYYSVEIRWIENRLPWLLPLLGWSIRTADAVTAISERTAVSVRGLAGREARVIPFAAAVSGPPGKTLRPALSSGEPLRLLFVGRLVQRKGVEHLVDALAIVRRSRPAVLTIVGDGEWRDVIRQAVARARVTEHVRMVGYVPEADLGGYYEWCDIFVLPAVVDEKGDTEGLGVVLLEALRFSRPVIASRLGGIPDVVQPGTTGWLVPPGDPAALATAVLEVAADPQGAHGVAAEGRRTVDLRFSLPRIVNDLDEVYGIASTSREAARRGIAAGSDG
jgi:glycosyltransferase involved in cell wall biosynthesis